MRDDLRKRGKLLMANATPWRIHAFAPLLDVMGTEVNWQPAGTWRPDPDSIFCLRRALCYRKPYLLLQNTDFDQFGVQQVERYFQRCMFYGVFPSMFSVDASTRNYWTQPQWYERDRDLFRKYIPVVAALSREGWEPITGAWTGREDVYVERYGRRYVTLLNDSQARRDVSLSMDPRVFAASQATVALQDVLTGERVSVRRVGARLVARVSVAPEQCRVLRVVGTKP
ncbi:MAG: hypothetical protein FJX72_13135 [Armatimonadetes bacterium]|nr:hypothetical protein [Armatimonadota bacterium]